MNEIKKVSDKMFKKTFADPANVRTFLKISLPKVLKERIDFSGIEIDPTEYVSNDFKESHSDMVIKTIIQVKKTKHLPLDIYFLFEHKTDYESKKKTLVQLLKYQYNEWQKDVDQKRPLRIIIPLVFYHGRKKWTVPQSFNGLFKVDDEVKEFLLDFRYILFDTTHWDFRAEGNEELRENVFLLTALVLMKCAFNDDTDSIGEIFKFWHRKGFTNQSEQIMFFLRYISETKDMNLENLQKILEDSNIEGGDVMPTLAQRLRDEGKAKWMKAGRQEGEKRGVEAEKIRTARVLLRRGMDVDAIIDITGIDRKKMEEIAFKGH